MESLPHREDKRMGIGYLAQLYHISPRTLRLYHEMGLFVPQYVNERTGYRSYSLEQLPRLEVIIQLKAMGLSLKRIEQMVEMQDSSMLAAMLSEQIDDLEEKITRYTALRDSLYRQLDSCRYLSNPPRQNHVFVEFIPRRRAMVFSIDKYDFRKEYKEERPWKDALEKIKAIFFENNVPMSYFCQIGCMIGRESLLRNEFLCDGAFVFAETMYPGVRWETIQSGTYVCMYRRYAAMDNIAESAGLEMLMDYIRDSGYQIVGPYLGETVAKTDLFNYSTHDVLIKLQIPVRLKDV